MSERRLFVLGRLAHRKTRLQAALRRLDRVLARLGYEDREAFSSLMILQWLLSELRHEPESNRRRQ